MVNRPKDIGTRTETAVARYLQDNGFPHAERRALRGRSDAGDLLICPGVIAEVKGGGAARTAGPRQIENWLREADAERVHAGAAHGLLIVQRLNRHEPGAAGWQVWLSLHDVLTLAGRPTFIDFTSTVLADDLRALPWSCSLSGVTALLRHAGYGNPCPHWKEA